MEKLEKIGVIGIGKTGISVIKHFLKTDSEIFIWDDDPNTTYKLQQYFSNKELKRLLINPPSEKVKLLSVLVPSPGIMNLPYIRKPHPLLKLANASNINILTDIDLLQLLSPKSRFIGITGTNGKSTTTSLLEHVLRSEKFSATAGGNIGLPVLQLPHDLDTYIIELSSFQLELIKAKLDISILLNITPDHTSCYKNHDAYIEAKNTIFKLLKPDGKAILPLDMRHILPKSVKNPFFFSRKSRQECNISLIDNILIYNNIHYDLSKSTVHPENILAVFMAASFLGVKAENIINSIINYHTLPHRNEFVVTKGSLTFINDSKATNSAACIYPLETYDNIIWIAGGIKKDDGLEELCKFKDKIKHIYLIGDSVEKFSMIFKKNKIPFTITHTLENTFHALSSSNFENATVLLSPSCASFDQWKNFEERGNAFKKLALNFEKSNIRTKECILEGL